ncbi:MAG TPA: hypothetical protein VGG39_19360 [Polyangiaceae bacterium]|jgi:hypothetical protein
MDGGPESTGPVVLDAMLRHGVAGAGRKLVLDAPLGWGCAGGPALDEFDDFLAEGGLSQATSREMLDRHYALYLLDTERECLDVQVLAGDKAPLEPIFVGENGELAALPPWYPRPNPEAKTEPYAPSAEAKQRVQAFCDRNRLRWSVLRGALRDWCLGSLGDLRGVSWLLAGSGDVEAFAGARVAGTMVHVSPDAGNARFTCSDGRLRRIDIDDVAGAGRIIDALARLPKHSGEIGRAGMPYPNHTDEAIKTVLSASYAEVRGSPLAHVSRIGGSWTFFAPSARYPNATETEKYPEGWVAPFLAFLLF